MDETLRSLIFRVQQVPPDSPERQPAILELVTQLLKARRVSRPCRGQPPTGIYRELFQAAQRYLQQLVEQEVDRFNLGRDSAREWAEELRQKVFQALLTDDRLQQLALAAQGCQPRTPAWQYAVEELTNAILVSGKLARLPHLSRELYTDAVNRTLLWVCQFIQTYNPDRGNFMAWVNYRLDMLSRSVQQDQRDSYTQSIQQRIIRLRSELKTEVQRVRLPQLHHWLSLHLKRLIPNLELSLNVIVYLVILVVLSQLIRVNSASSNELIYAIVRASIVMPPEIIQVEEPQLLEAIAQPDSDPALTERVRDYLERDPEGLCQRHMRDRPQATFQAIALARMDERSWQELSIAYNAKIAALSNFYQRTLKQLAPHIRRYIQD